MSRRPSHALIIAFAMCATTVAAVQGASPAPSIPSTASPSAGAVWPGFRGGPARDGAGTGGPVGQPVLRWRYQAQGAANTDIAIGDGLAFSSTDDGILHALDLATGAERWSITAKHAPFGGPAFSDDTVFVVDGIGVAHAYDATTGAERWHTDAPIGIPGYSGEVSDGVLYVESDTALSAIDTSTGVVRWTYAPAAGGGVHAPAVSDGLVYASTDLGGYVALDVITGAPIWTHGTGDDIVATAVVADGVAFAGATDDPPGHLTAFDAKSGVVLWSDDEQLHAPAVADGIAVSGGPIGVVVAHDLHTGTELWRTPIAGKTRPVAIADGVAYVAADTQHRVIALDLASGREVWRFDVDAGLDCCATVADGAVFVGTGLGDIYAIGGGSGEPVPSPAAPASAAPATPMASASEAPGFNGMWHTDPLTEDQVAAAFVAAGGTDADGRDFFRQLGGGSTSTAVITIGFDAESFTEWETGDAGVPAIGLRGRYDVSPDGVMTLKAGSCTQTFSRTGAADDLLLLKTLSQCPGDGLYTTTLFASFPFHPGSTPTAATSASPGAGSPAAGIPDGRYSTGPLTSDQVAAAVRALGYDPAAADLLGKDWVFMLQFDTGRLRIYMGQPGQPPAVGWSGTFSIVDGDTFTAGDGTTSITYDYHVDGDVLTIHMVSDTLQDPGELAAQTGIFDTAPFVLEH